LAEEGTYIASESSFYRVLRNERMMNHREKSKPPKNKRPSELEAVRTNQVWSWDITYLKTTVKGIFFYLYMIMDIFSRKIVGWNIYENEDSLNARELFKNTVGNDKLPEIYLHSDNGGPMKGATFVATLQNLGITPSYSRPGCSNDNAFSESLFKTLKYRISYPKAFYSILDAKKWTESFVNWYNTEHRHSGINFVTPEQKHEGNDIELLRKRMKTFKEAKMLHPERWIKNKIRNCEVVEKTILNKRKSKDYAA
jgi:transposase InsO family protein